MQDRISIPSSWHTSRTSLSLFAVLLMLAALAWASGEPWKGKPYQQWNDKDVQRVFTDSPWSRTALLTRTWLPLSTKDFPGKALHGSEKSLPSGLEHSDEAVLGMDVNFNVYWFSSRVMRAASARQAVLHGQKKDVDVEKYAAEPQDEFQIVIQGKDMAPFIRKDEKFFQANALLEMKRTKLKVAPSHVTFEHDEDPRIVSAAVFFFPKKTPSGDPTIASDEKNVEFSCRIEGATLRVNFEPQKMVDQNGPAL
jgi:hypothetical protein